MFILAGNDILLYYVCAYKTYLAHYFVCMYGHLGEISCEVVALKRAG